MSDIILPGEIRRRDLLKTTAAGLALASGPLAAQSGAKKGNRIDIHAHVWTDEYLDMMERFGVKDTSVQRKKGAGPNEAEMEKRFEQMDAVKVTKQILSICPQAPHFEDKNNAVAAARAITVTAQSNTKLYDGATSAAALPMITTGDLASGDTAAWTESYDTKDVGVGKTLVPAGSVSDDNDGKNYAITFVSDSTGVITPVSLTVAGLSALNRVYDGTPVAAITGAPVLSGVVVGDTVTMTGVASGVFADAQLGAHKQVTVTGLALGGSDSGNYTLTLPTLFADITGLPPVAGDYEMGTWRDQTNNISTRKLLRVCSDPGHYSLSITAAGPSSARGGALRLVGEIITYTPVSGFVGIDTFQYTVANTLGLTAQGTVTVVVRPSDRQGPSVIGSPEIKDGAVIVRFAGIPGIEYNVEATEDLNNWATIGSATAGANGLFQYVDTDAAEHPSRFYRCRKP